jgi:hypothetical protein
VATAGGKRLTWEDPPPPHRRADQVSHADVARKLKARPKQWAVVSTYPNSRTAGATASAIRAGRVTAYLPVGEWEATSRTVDGEHRVYARYMGGAKDVGHPSAAADQS